LLAVGFVELVGFPSAILLKASATASVSAFEVAGAAAAAFGGYQ